MSLKALDAILEATRAKKLRWQMVEPERYETVGEPKVCIEFHYPQVGDETTTGADIVVISFGGVSLSFFSGSEGAARISPILREAFPEWREHQENIEDKINEFIKRITKA